MKVRLHLLFRITIILVTGMLILFGLNMPDKRTPIFPLPGAAVSLYSDASWGGQTSAMWTDQASNQWMCNLVQSQFAPVCGLAADLSAEGRSMDLSQQTAIAIRMKYVGEAQRLRIYLRNHNPEYSTPEDPDSLKFNSVNIPAGQFDAPETIIRLNEFSVEPWWLEERSMSRELSHPELDTVLSLGIDYPYPHTMGEHSIELEGIDIIGPLFNPKSYITFFVTLIFSLLLIEFLLLLTLNKRGQPNSALQNENPPNELENEHLVGPQPTAKEGLKQKISQVFCNNTPEAATTLVLFKVNDFQVVVRSKGKDYANQLMVSLEAHVNAALDSCDTMARWGDQEFLVLSTSTATIRAREMIERIQAEVKLFSETIESFDVEISIGGTAITTTDDFGTAFLRAEQALYQAGKEGTQSYWIENE